MFIQSVTLFKPENRTLPFLLKPLETFIQNEHYQLLCLQTTKGSYGRKCYVQRRFERVCFLFYRENLEDLQQIVAQLENDRFIASRRAQRLEEELKSQEKVWRKKNELCTGSNHADKVKTIHLCEI